MPTQTLADFRRARNAPLLLLLERCRYARSSGSASPSRSLSLAINHSKVAANGEPRFLSRAKSMAGHRETGMFDSEQTVMRGRKFRIVIDSHRSGQSHRKAEVAWQDGRGHGQRIGSGSEPAAILHWAGGNLAFELLRKPEPEQQQT